MTNNNKLCVGIDIGGTNTVFGLVNNLGECIEEVKIKTSDYPIVDDFVLEVSNKIKTMLANHPTKHFLGIGIGAPNGNYYSGSIDFAPNLQWKGEVPLVKLFSSYFDIPIVLTNDANAAAMGERIYGSAQGIDDFIMVTLGTGLGSGFVINGEIVYGNDGFAGELGHTIIEKDGRLCGCGRNGCLETYVSATAIVNSMKELIQNGHKSSLCSLSDISSKSISDAALDGDKAALLVFDMTAQKLGFALANTVAITSPKLIVLFGGLAESGDLIIQPTKAYMEKYLLDVFKNKIEIVPSQLMSDHAAILGASSLVW